MNPIRMLYGRRLMARLAYWLSALGLNLRDTSTGNRVYTVYLLVFWLIWAVAVFALVGSNVATVFRALPNFDLPALWVTLALLALTGWSLWTLWQAGQRSPFIFTEEDAYLVSQTPVRRSTVALALFFSNWAELVVPFMLGTIIFCFAGVEVRLPGDLTPEKVLEYVRYSGQALLVVVPLHLALQALVWALGATRLRGHRDQPWLRAAAPVLLALIAASALIPAGLGGSAATPVNFARPVLLWPVWAALTAGFDPAALIDLGQASPASWLLAVGLAVVAAVAAVGLLALATGRLSLSRAAQETASHASLLLARSYGRTDVVDYLQMRARLKGERKPSRLLATPGHRVLLSKDLLQTGRTLTVAVVLGWLVAGGLAVGVFISPSIPLKLLVGALWVLAVGRATTLRLRSDLAHWWILRLLPFDSGAVFRMDFALPWGLTVAFGALGLLVVDLPPVYRLGALVLLPALVASLACAAGSDILRQAHVRTLMVPSLAVENVPQMGIGGLLQGAVSVAIPLALLEAAMVQPGGALFLAGAVVSALFIAVINLGVMMSAYRWMR